MVKSTPPKQNYFTFFFPIYCKISQKKLEQKMRLPLESSSSSVCCLFLSFFLDEPVLTPLCATGWGLFTRNGDDGREPPDGEAPLFENTDPATEILLGFVEFAFVVELLLTLLFILVVVLLGELNVIDEIDGVIVESVKASDFISPPDGHSVELLRTLVRFDCIPKIVSLSISTRGTDTAYGGTIMSLRLPKLHSSTNRCRQKLWVYLHFK